MQRAGRWTWIILMAMVLLACGDDKDPPSPQPTPQDTGEDALDDVIEEPDTTLQEDTDVEDTLPDIVEDATPDMIEPQCTQDEECGRNGVCTDGECLVRLRVATWNVERVGEVGSVQFDAALAVVRRLGAEVLALQEIDGAQDVLALESFAAQAGYPHVAIAEEGTFGAERNAIISALPFLDVVQNNSASLSTSPDANDITRPMLEVRVAPEGGRPLTIVVHHAKSGASNLDEFRRVCESFRLAQTVADLDPGFDHFVLLGDFNESINAGVQTPESFDALPEGLPPAFTLGEDLSAALADGLQNNPFFLLQRGGGPQVSAIEAFQLDGSPATRPDSGRQIDYILASAPLLSRGALAEVYSAQHEALDEPGLPKRPPALGPETSAEASDHLPVFADLLIAREAP